jgi:ubiquinone/menaquinone biosynthesis C-methylase UbiE
MPANPYSVLVRFYDRASNLEVKRSAARLMVEKLSAMKSATRSLTVVDLACGTGNVTRALLALGTRVVAVDLSLPMLVVAKRKLRNTNEVLFVNQDIRHLSLRPLSCDGAICLSFSLAYIEYIAELYEFAARLRRSIRDGGVILFDMIEMDALRGGWLQQEVRRWSRIGVQVSVEWTRSEDRVYRMVYAMRDVDGGSVVESHAGRAYADHELREAFTAGGFEISALEALSREFNTPHLRYFLGRAV